MALLRRSLTVIVITTRNSISSCRHGLRSLGVLRGVTHSRCVCRKHPGSLSLTCPELILPGVRHEIGFRDRGVLRACLPSAAPECHFNAAETHSDPHGLKPRRSPSKSKLLKTSGPGTPHYPGSLELKIDSKQKSAKLKSHGYIWYRHIKHLNIPLKVLALRLPSKIDCLIQICKN